MEGSGISIIGVCSLYVCVVCASPTFSLSVFFQSSHEDLVSRVLPTVVRAYDDSDPRIQEEVLKRTVPLTKLLDPQVWPVIFNISRCIF